MSAEGIEPFEQQAAELVAAAKGLLKEFEGRIGESLHAQRMAASEARAEGVRVSQQLAELGRLAQTLIGEQRNLLGRIEREWQLHIDSNAQRAGEVQAKAFGADIAAGLEERLAGLAAEVAAATRRFTWASTLRWTLGIALAVPLTINMGVRWFSPSIERLNVSVEGLTPLQTRDALSGLMPCRIEKTNWRDWHVCIGVDDPPRLAKGPHGETVVVVRGM